MSVVWFNGALMDEHEALVPALDRGVLWGYGLFETVRAYGGRVWALDDHYERLRRGAEIVDLEVPQEPTIRGAMDEVLHANDLADAGVRLTITAGTGPADPQADPDEPPNVLVTAWRLRDYRELYDSGAALITIAGGPRPLAGLKTTSYAVSVAGRVLARRAGADDGLFVGADGAVFEATASNLFIVRGDELVTPPLADAILPGITRRHVLRVAEQSGLVTQEMPLRLDDLFAADEVLLTSSLREVYAARAIDGRDVNRGGIAEKLRSAYHAAVLAELG